MGYVELIVGKLDEDTEADVLDALGSVDATEAPWRHAEPDRERIILLNIASVGRFLAHVASLDGLDVARAAEASPYAQLPWGMPAVWLPLDQEPVPSESELAFIGSAVRLRQDLEEVRRRSPLALDVRPPGYDRMRRDADAFLRGAADAAPVEAVEAWVWQGLHEGSTLALSRGAPLFCW